MNAYLMISDFLSSVRQATQLTRKERKLLAEFPHIDESGKGLIRNLCCRLLARTGGTVYSGPFSGMRLLPNGTLASRPVWIVGCYEQEIEAALSDLIADPPNLIIDIGSAHGYFAVGLATQIEGVRVIGFEEQEFGHWEEARQLAKLNGVTDRFEQKGHCDIQSLGAVIEANSGIVCDCEGAEVDILDPERLPVLKTCRIICEVHDFFREGATRILVQRFSKTHKISLINEQARNPFQFRVLDGFSSLEQILAVRETKHIPGRLTMGRYLWMVPKAND